MNLRKMRYFQGYFSHSPSSGLLVVSYHQLKISLLPVVINKRQTFSHFFLTRLCQSQPLSHEWYQSGWCFEVQVGSSYLLSVHWTLSCHTIIVTMRLNYRRNQVNKRKWHGWLTWAHQPVTDVAKSSTMVNFWWKVNILSEWRGPRNDNNDAV